MLVTASLVFPSWLRALLIGYEMIAHHQPSSSQADTLHAS